MRGSIVSAAIVIQIFFLIAIIVFKSFGAIPRWDLLDQISIADRIVMNLPMYPDANGEWLWGVSVYFPGVALVAALLMEVLPQASIVFAMLIIAAAVTFCSIFIQKKIVYSMYGSYEPRNFWPSMIVISLTVCYQWLTYASELKPDTLAYLIGSVCVLANEKFRDKPSIAFILGVFTGGALIFKQQHIAFIIGYLSYCIFTRNGGCKPFLIGILIGSAAVIGYLFADESMFFWTIDVLADDGYLSIDDWLSAHSKFALVSFLSVLGLFSLHLSNKLRLDFPRFGVVARGAISTPFPWIIISSFCVAFASSWKLGGNSGNTAYGVFLMSPIILIILERAGHRVLITISALVLLLHLPSVTQHANRLRDIVDFKVQVDSVLKNRCSGVVVGSDLYYAVREACLGHQYQNYWTHALRKNSDVLEGAQLRNFVSDKRNKFFVAEDFPVNKEIFLDQDDLELVFENKIGLIAVRK